MGKKTIVLAAAEAVPFVKVGGLADVAGALFKKFRSLHHTFLLIPHSRQIKDKFPAEPVAELTVFFSNTRQEPGTLYKSEQFPGAYFISHPEYFSRPELYGPGGKDYPDNAERFSFFSRAVLEACRLLNLNPDIFHCHDWHTGLLPLYLEQFYGTCFPKARTVFTIHNLAYQGVFPAEKFPLLGLPAGFFNMEELEFYGKVNLMKAGLLHSHILNTVSPRYSQEILTPEFGCKLEGVLNKRRDRLSGIVNGIDYQIWNPMFDTVINRKYRSSRGKMPNKVFLQQTLGLAPGETAPLFGFVGRLVEQKGVDFILKIIPNILKAGGQLVMLGDGDPNYKKQLTAWAERAPKQIFVSFGFHDDLAHRIYAGADFFLMPSRFEPCGLGQLISLKYGTIPIVKRVGGLADTVEEYNSSTGGGWGFTFGDGTDEFWQACRKALVVFDRKEEWGRLVDKAMQLDFSWKKSAGEYLKLYDLAGRVA